MALNAGTRLGPYEIVAPIGAGGMGEVYRARDNKLGRDVAIKVLPEEFSQDRQKLARFDREARFLAALNHPGIATLHGLEEVEGKPFLVMELVEGETLAERISRGPIPVHEAMTLSKQIADALEAAHEKGVIHRDLKPSNIKVNAEGRVKVLDFGLAKAFGDDVPESDLSQSPTLSRDATKTGVILGTAVYMSPEQARGKAIDKRTDIFSFGAVLYEMLTGKKAYRGEDVSDVLAAVIRSEPDWKGLPSDLPPSVIHLLRRCLTKDRKERLQAIGEARIAAERYLAAPEEAVAAKETTKTRRPVLWQAIAGLCAVAFLAALWMLWPSERSPVRLSVELGSGLRPLASFSTVGAPRAVISPDGKSLALVGVREDGVSQLYIRPLGSLEAIPLGGTEGARLPFFSPDSQWLGFFTGGVLKKVSVSGGAALTITELPSARGGTWGPDETIVYGTATTGLYRVAAAGGTPVELTTLRDGEVNHRYPAFLPNGKAVLFSYTKQGSSFWDDSTIEAIVLETGERKVIQQGGTAPRYASSGHLLYAQEATLFAVPFDPNRIETTGAPSPVIEEVQVLPVAGSGAADFSVANNGTLVYVPETVSIVRGKLVWVDREGVASPPLTETLGDWETPRISPDGTRVAVRKMEDSGQQDVWLLELSRGTLQRLTFEDGLRPLWAPDGSTLFFGSNRAGAYNVFSKPADGSGPAEELTTGTFRVPSSITSDGKTLVLRHGGDGASPNLDIGRLDPGGGAEPEMLLETAFHEHTPKLSPDDRWLAYVSDESGRDEIYVTHFPRGGKWQISTEGGREPLWSRDGRELFYRNDDQMMAVDISGGPDSAGKPVVLFEGPYALKEGSGATNYDVADDGRFLMIQTEARSTGATHVTLVLNWFEELKRLVPASD